MADIPKRFGGDFDYQHNMLPMLDSASAKKLTWLPPYASFPMGPKKWIDDGKGRRIAVAVGSEHERGKVEKLATMPSSKRNSVASRRS